MWKAPKVGEQAWRVEYHRAGSAGDRNQGEWLGYDVFRMAEADARSAAKANVARGAKTIGRVRAVVFDGYDWVSS